MKKKVKDFNDLYETINNVVETDDQTEINQLIQNLDIDDMEELIDLEIETKENK